MASPEMVCWDEGKYFAKQWLVMWVAAAHGVEADALMSEVHLATHQAMNPVFSDREGVGEQRHVALLVASTQDRSCLLEQVLVDPKITHLDLGEPGLLSVLGLRRTREPAPRIAGDCPRSVRGVNRELMPATKLWVLIDQSAAMEDPNLTTVPLDFHRLAYQRKGHQATIRLHCA